ncbi:MAG: efflux RND transporter periplasmic adaptor subunit [Chitinophagaceae bacterium]
MIVFISCSNVQTTEEDGAVTVKTTVTFTLPTKQGFTDYIQLNGNTQFQKKLVIRSTITGYITNMRWKAGDHISPGTLFCNIQTKEQNALKNIDSNEPSLKQFQKPLTIFANASGIFTAVNYSNEDFVNEGDILATITDPSSMILLVNVPYEYHQFVYKGRTCSITFPDGKIINAIIQEEVPIVEAVSQTQSFLIRFPGNRLLPENMNLIVHIPLKQKQNAISLPLEAIQTNETQDEFWVMKLIGDSLALRVPITVGLQNDSLREVISGVEINDKIIVTGAYGLTDSSLVRVQSEKE